MMSFIFKLQSFGDTYLPLTLLFHLILSCLSWVQLRKEDLHFILSYNSNYDFDVKMGRCGFVGFVSDVINCECFECAFFFFFLNQGERERHILYQL